MITKPITEDESVVLKKSANFFRELFEKDLNGKTYDSVVDIIGNIIIFGLSNACLQLAEHDERQAFNFINQVCDATKKEYVKQVREHLIKNNVNLN